MATLQDRFNINSQLEHLQAKYIGTGHADLQRFEWAGGRPLAALILLDLQHVSLPCLHCCVRSVAAVVGSPTVATAILTIQQVVHEQTSHDQLTVCRACLCSPCSEHCPGQLRLIHRAPSHAGVLRHCAE